MNAVFNATGSSFISVTCAPASTFEPRGYAQATLSVLQVTTAVEID